MTGVAIQGKELTPLLSVHTEYAVQDKQQHYGIEISHLTKTFKTKKGDFTAIDDLSLNIKKGEFCAIVGPSGCGKTTLLRILAGLERQTDGEVIMRYDSQDKPLNSMVFQDSSIFPWMSVKQNVEYGLKMRKVPKKIRSEIAKKWLTKVGLEKFSEAYPHQLSGGMKQRVSVARAFANDPEILLMDEPFGAVDEQNRLVLQEELLQLWEEEKKTVVFITHSIDEAVSLADRVVVMSASPGRIREILPIKFPRPRSVYELRKDPLYGETVYHIWQLLHKGK